MMKLRKNKKKKNEKDEELDPERREFIRKSAKQIGGYGYALYELAKEIKEDVIQKVVDDIKEEIKKP
jgi:hypothetical protein